MPLYTLLYRISDPDDRASGIIILRGLLWLPAQLFKIAGRLRNYFYTMGWRVQQRLPVRVISVGGLTVGGAGKTPVVRHLARLLSDTGQRVVVLSRGYGRLSKAVVVASSVGDECLPWHRVGDEPFLLASTQPGVPVVVGADRIETGQHAIRQFAPDILILDDGFQHRRLSRDLDIVVLDATSPAECLIPAGPLREPWSALRRADLIILTRVDQAETLDTLVRRIRRYNPEIQIVETAYRPAGLRHLSDSRSFPLDQISGCRVVTLAGIANPVSFEQTIRQIGAEVVHMLRYQDHHVYQNEEIELACEAASRTRAQWIVTTEKDAIRIPESSDRTRILVLDIELDVVRDGNVLESMVSNAAASP